MKLDDDAFWRVTFGGSRGNILDIETMAVLASVFCDARDQSGVKAIVLEGAGDDFSFGASVQEHQPEHLNAMLAQFRELLFAILDSSVVVLAAVRGQCLGGGLEVAAIAHRIFAHPTAKFGQPEISLGVFAPFASILLPIRLHRRDAEDLCLTGRSIDAREAEHMGLVDDVVNDPFEVALAWARTRLGSKSARSLRLAVRAVRASLTNRLRSDLPAVEKLYVEDLMSSSDPVEGLRAFLEKRPPKWTNS